MAATQQPPLSTKPMSVLSFFGKFIHSQWTRLPQPEYDFSGQTIIVTGSNTGLGFEAAKHFVRLNAAKVILAVRTLAKGEAAKERIVQTLNLDSLGAARIEIWLLDLGNYDSVLAFGERAAKLDRLDAVVQNAGILTAQWAVQEGFDSQIAVNTVGATLLGLALLPTLQRSAKAQGKTGRLSFVGSEVAYLVKFDELKKYPRGPVFDALKDRSIAFMNPPLGRYGVSKLLLWYAVRWIAAAHPVSPESNVIINVQSPGACVSDLMRDDVTWIEGIIKGALETLIARTTEVGSRTMVHAVNPDLEREAHGRLLLDCKVSLDGPNIESPEGQRLAVQFVEELKEKLEATRPGITKFS